MEFPPLVSVCEVEQSVKELVIEECKARSMLKDAELPRGELSTTRPALYL